MMKSLMCMRTVVKWGGVVMTLMLVVAWIAGVWWSVSWTSESGFTFGGWSGCVFAGYEPTSSPIFIGGGWHVHGPGFRAAENEVPFMLWFHGYRSATDWGTFVPIWLLAMFSACAAFVAWRLETNPPPLFMDRQMARLKLCRGCGYDRAGLAPGAVCPECGARPIG